ncbi:Lanosterol 14-alpha-demethylase [Ceratobasidium sp. 392]|nr:Lanosterol 14-alpha-demethylase [Ceratobasidium sp. 392]
MISIPFDSPQAPSVWLVVSGLFVLGTVIVALNVVWQLLAPRDPSLPPQVFHILPIIGSAIQYGRDPIGFLFSCREKYGDLFTFVLLGRRMTVALGPKGSNFVLGGKLSEVSAGDAYAHLITPVFGKDVVYDVPNHIFMEQKKFIKFGLTAENFRKYVGMIEDETKLLLEKELSVIPSSKSSNGWCEFHALKTMAELTILTASRTLQGKEVRRSLDKSFAQTYQDLDGGFTPLNFLFPNLPLPSYWRRDRAHKRMSDFYVRIIESRRRQNQVVEEYDMTSALLSQEYKDGRSLGDHEAAHLMIALLMAGQHTSSSTSSWALLHLADRPDVAEEMFKEQVDVFGNKDGSFRPLTYEEMKNLPVLNSVIRETLRMHPPIHSIMRKCVSDMVVPASLVSPTGKSNETSSYVIPKGHFLLASPAVAQVDPLVWRDANVWEPSRWFDPTGVAAQAESLYLGEQGEKIDYGWGAISKGTESPYQPFGAGRHRCIGEQFANLQLGTILSTVVRSIEMRLSQSFPPHNYHTLIVQPREPCMIEFRFRKPDECR